jgi:fructose-1,6-bisphosphatase/inositol monophosphatase family enzyme
MLLVKEAGGFVSNLNGKFPVPGDELAICASSEELGRRVLKIAQESYPVDWDNYGFRGKPKS